jgi:hypothetical protein
MQFFSIWDINSMECLNCELATPFACMSSVEEDAPLVGAACGKDQPPRVCIVVLDTTPLLIFEIHPKGVFFCIGWPTIGFFKAALTRKSHSQIGSCRNRSFTKHQICVKSLAVEFGVLGKNMVAPKPPCKSMEHI